MLQGSKPILPEQNISVHALLQLVDGISTHTVVCDMVDLCRDYVQVHCLFWVETIEWRKHLLREPQENVLRFNVSMDVYWPFEGSSASFLKS